MQEQYPYLVFASRFPFNNGCFFRSWTPVAVSDKLHIEIYSDVAQHFYILKLNEINHFITYGVTKCTSIHAEVLSHKANPLDPKLVSPAECFYLTSVPKSSKPTLRLVSDDSK